MDTHTLTTFCLWLPYGSVVAAGVSGIIRFRRLPLGLRYVALVAGFDMVMELTSLALVWAIHYKYLKSNLFMGPLSAIGEVTLLALAYREALQSARFTRLMPWVVGLFSAYALFDTFVGLSVVRFATSVQILADLLQLGLAMLYFWKLLSELRVEHLRQEPFFWVSVGLVVYVLGDMLITLVSNYLLKHYSHNLQILIIHAIRPLFLAALYCAYTLALWMRPPKSNSFSS